MKINKSYSIVATKYNLIYELIIICLICIPFISTAQNIDNVIIKEKGIYNISDTAFVNIDFNQKNLILFGDSNLSQLEPAFYYSVFKYFHKKGVRFLVIDLPVCHERTLNEFIRTGNKEILRGYGSTYKEFLSLLHEYYQHLSPSDKFEIVAVDIDCFTSKYFNSLYELIPKNKKVPPELIPIVDTITKYYKRGTFKYPYNIDKNGLELVYSSINEDFKANESIFSEYLGTDVELFGRIIDGNKHILCSEEFNGRNISNYRNEYIVSKLQSVFKISNYSVMGFFDFIDINKSCYEHDTQHPKYENFVIQLHKHDQTEIKNIYTIKITSKNIESSTSYGTTNSNSTEVLDRKDTYATIVRSTEKSSDYVIFIPKSFLLRKKSRDKIEKLR